MGVKKFGKCNKCKQESKLYSKSICKSGFNDDLKLDVLEANTFKPYPFGKLKKNEFFDWSKCSVLNYHFEKDTEISDFGAGEQLKENTSSVLDGKLDVGLTNPDVFNPVELNKKMSLIKESLFGSGTHNFRLFAKIPEISLDEKNTNLNSIVLASVEISEISSTPESNLNPEIPKNQSDDNKNFIKYELAISDKEKLSDQDTVAEKQIDEVNSQGITCTANCASPSTALLHDPISNNYIQISDANMEGEHFEVNKVEDNSVRPVSRERNEENILDTVKSNGDIVNPILEEILFFVAIE